MHYTNADQTYLLEYGKLTKNAVTVFKWFRGMSIVVVRIFFAGCKFTAPHVIMDPP